MLDKVGERKTFSRLPKPRAEKSTARTGPGSKPSKQNAIPTLPSGKLLDIKEIFLAQLNDGNLLRVESRQTGQRISYTKHPNGKLSGMVTEIDGTLNGPAISLYETGTPATLANYVDGQLSGNLLTWEAAGEAKLFAQYLKGKENGLACLFDDGDLLLVQEATRRQS